MTNGAVHVGDVGTVFLCIFRNPDDTPFDISAATTKEINFQRPDGTAFVRAGAFVTTGTDGQLSYALAPGDIDQAGYWYLQGHVVFASGDDLHSDRVRTRVRDNNAAPS